MSTSQQINQVLQVLGLSGLDATNANAINPAAALLAIMKGRRITITEPAKVIYELKRQALAQVNFDGTEVSFRLTPAGIHRLQRYRLDSLVLRLPRRWDKKWRTVAFDIPTKQSKERAAFVQRLRELGFTMLQKSLWVYPAECFDVVIKLADFY